MIKVNSILEVADNSGVKTVKCIKIMSGYKKKYATVGDIIIVTVKEMRSKSYFKKCLKIKKKDIFKALVVRVKNYIEKKSRIKMCFKLNSAVLVDKIKNPIGSRVFGFLPRILKLNYSKCFSISLKKL